MTREPAPVVLPCAHRGPRRGGGREYDYCPDCGATRRADRPGEQPDRWHLCYLCALPRRPERQP
jgi:hypothetical protein